MADLLEGWSYPLSETIKGVKILDHTFVKAPNNGPSYFDCFGGHEASTAHRLEGASGKGDYAVANCYRIPSLLPDTAGLAPYGVHGVCHQAANRFLWSASSWLTGPTVRKAQGYVLSFSFYGTFGRPIFAPPPPEPWAPNIVPPTDFMLIYRRCKKRRRAVREEEDRSVQPTGFEQRLAALHTQLQEGVSKDRNAVFDQELRLLVEENLGVDFEFEKIQEIRSEALKGAYKVATSDLRGESFAHEINGCAVQYLDDMEAHLGAENYSRLLMMPPKERYALVDPGLADRDGTGGTAA